VCPEECIDLISLLRIDSTEKLLAPYRLPDGAPVELLEGGEGAALIKDETACIRCGLCARRCPTSCITMQAFYLEDEAAVMTLAEQVL
jgi:NAD-dependent dihydropyrimidine dehydrogenase PreA subunit